MSAKRGFDALTGLAEELKKKEREGTLQKADPRGSFVLCKFPYDDNFPGFSGLKRRPVFVLDVLDHQELGYSSAIVLYASSSLNQFNRLMSIDSDVLVDLRDKNSGLKGSVSLDQNGNEIVINFLDISRAAHIPVTDEFFPSGLKQIGRLSEHAYQKIVKKREELHSKKLLGQPFLRRKFLTGLAVKYPGRLAMVWEPVSRNKKSRGFYLQPKWVSLQSSKNSIPCL